MNNHNQRRTRCRTPTSVTFPATASAITKRSPTCSAPNPQAGRLALIVGEADGALHIVDVWDSKAHADHFAAERLIPAFQQAGVKPGPEESYLEFDTNVLELGARDN